MVDKFGVSPPVDLQLIADSCAEVELDDIPGRCDGLVVGLHGPRDRPLILLDRATAHQRSRFTFAHELGHVFLPWHLGDYLCYTAQPFSDEHHHAAAAEVQANRFAAHLLVPEVWLTQLIDRAGARPVLPLLEAIEAADVSAPVACLRLADRLPSGFVFAITDASGVVKWSGQTNETKVVPPQKDAPLERSLLDRAAVQVEETKYGSRRVVWWSFQSDTLPDDSEAHDERRASDVLNEILGRHVGDDAAKAKQQLSGVIGYANSVARKRGIHSKANLYAFFRSRFASERSLPDGLLDDPDFDAWLRKRAEELGE